MIVAAVADTHTAVWYIFGDIRLSGTARWFIEQTAQLGGQIGISSISFAELVYLCEKGRLSKAALTDLVQAVAAPKAVFQELPFDLKVVMRMKDVAREMVPDMPDRIVTATALRYGVPVISKDERIRSSGVRTIW